MAGTDETTSRRFAPLGENTALPPGKVYFPAGFNELFSIWNSLDDADLYAGGTGHIRYSEASAISRNIISLDKLEELQKISRTERHIEIGSMVTLNKIIHLGKIVPEALIRCLEHIGGLQLRNLATIGGNICNPKGNFDASCPMVALDAQYELRTEQSSRWISASRFSSSDGPALGKRELLTRIRVPLEPWHFTWYRKFKSHGDDIYGGNILFILRNQKNILTGIRVVYSGQVILMEKNSETLLVGKHLPLERKFASAFVASWKHYLSGILGMENSIFSGKPGKYEPELVKTQILSFIETIIMRISE